MVIMWEGRMRPWWGGAREEQVRNLVLCFLWVLGGVLSLSGCLLWVTVTQSHNLKPVALVRGQSFSLSFISGQRRRKNFLSWLPWATWLISSFLEVTIVPFDEHFHLGVTELLFLFCDYHHWSDFQGTVSVWSKRGIQQTPQMKFSHH